MLFACRNVLRYWLLGFMLTGVSPVLTTRLLHLCCGGGARAGNNNGRVAGSSGAGAGSVVQLGEFGAAAVVPDGSIPRDRKTR